MSKPGRAGRAGRRRPSRELGLHQEVVRHRGRRLEVEALLRSDAAVREVRQHHQRHRGAVAAEPVAVVLPERPPTAELGRFADARHGLDERPVLLPASAGARRGGTRLVAAGGDGGLGLETRVVVARPAQRWVGGGGGERSERRPCLRDPTFGDRCSLDHLGEQTAHRQRRMDQHAEAHQRRTGDGDPPQRADHAARRGGGHRAQQLPDADGGQQRDRQVHEREQASVPQPSLRHHRERHRDPGPGQREHQAHAPPADDRDEHPEAAKTIT
jgi:hypothetical protein